MLSPEAVGAWFSRLRLSIGARSTVENIRTSGPSRLVGGGRANVAGRYLKEPLRSMTIVAVSLGLRASELLGLKWKHVDWLNSKLSVEQRIYRQQVDDTKTRESSGQLNLDASVLQVLKDWRQVTQFRGEEDWIWASPTQLGRLPISYPWYWRCFNDATIKAGVGALGTHTLRHTYRSWMDSVGTPIAVQQKLMRHSDIRTTMNVYGDVVDDRMKEAHSKVAALVFTSTAPEKGRSEQGSEDHSNAGSTPRSV